MLRYNFLSFVAITLVSCFLGVVLGLMVGQSDQLTCKRQDYVQCQYQHRYFYGMWSQETLSFRIRGAEVESYTHEDGDGVTLMAYVLYLQTNTGGWIKFRDYGGELHQAQADMKQIHDVISGFASSDLQIDRGQWGRDLFTAICVVLVSCLMFSRSNLSRRSVR